MTPQVAVPEPSDATVQQLHEADWSIGDDGGPRGWVVHGHRGDQMIESLGQTQSEAWANAVELGQALPDVNLAKPRRRG